MSKKGFRSEELRKKGRISQELFEDFLEMNLLSKKSFYSELDLEVIRSFKKLKKLGYEEGECLKILADVGAPKEENLFEDPSYLYIKDVAANMDIPERTVKYYEKLGIIAPAKVYRNKRFYKRNVLSELQLAASLKSLGYKLKEVNSILGKLKEGKKKQKMTAALKEELSSKADLIKIILKQLENLDI